MYNMKNKRPERKKEAAPVPEGAAETEQRYPLLSLVLSIGLPVLFLVCLIAPVPAVRWVFLALTGISVLAMWMLRAFVPSARNTLTVIYAALAVVIGLALFISRQTPEARLASSPAVNRTSLYSFDPGQENAGAVSAESGTPEPDAQAQAEEAQVSEAQMRMDGFFRAWAMVSVTEMKEYCLPSWVNEQQSPEKELFQRFKYSYPVNYTPEDTSGSDGANSRIITVKATFNENGEYVVKRLRVIMRKVNDVWYVDPNSLDGVKVDEAAEAAAKAQNQMIASTIAPTATPGPAGSSLTVYYNVHGGKYYHLSPTCDAVDSSYWPLTGVIPFELINSKEYSKLIPCQKCGAPARPAQ